MHLNHVCADCSCVTFSIKNLYHKQILSLCAESLATPENRPTASLFSPPPRLPQRKDAPFLPSVSPLSSHSAPGQLVNSLSCLHFFRVMDKSPTRSKMRATTPMEPETAVAAVCRLREVNERTRMLQCPGRLWGPSTRWPWGLPTAALPPPQQPTVSCLQVGPLPSAPISTPWSHPHRFPHGAKQAPFQDPRCSSRASPSFTHLLGSAGPEVAVVMFPAERERTFGSNSNACYRLTACTLP